MPGWKSLRYRLEAGLCALLARALPKLSRQGCVRLANLVGAAAFRFDRRGRTAGLANIECALGDRFTAAERRKIVRRSYENFAQTMLDLFWGVRVTPENYREWVDLEGMEAAEAQLAREKKGGIFLCIHQGNWELASLLGGIVGKRLAVVTAYFKNPYLADLFRRLREQKGSEMLPQEHSLLRMLKIVKRNGLTGMLIDLNLRPSQAATVIDTFAATGPGGEPLRMCVPLLHAVLAQRVGTPLFPAETIPQPNGRCRVIVHPAIVFPEGASLQQISQACWEVFERMIHAHPEHWLWPYKHFRYRPKGARRIYPPYANESGKFEKLLRQEQPAPRGPL